MSAHVKICGLGRPIDVATCAQAGVRYVGFVFFEKSPRNLTYEAAKSMAIDVPVGIAKVALTVDASDEMLNAMLDDVPIDILQLQGSETPDRVAEIRSRFGLPVMKAVGVADEGDLAALDDYATVADQLLVDAKPPKNAKLPGGNGVSFDWRLISNRRWSVPWMLAGGLNAGNVAEAIRLTGASQVDVSSGVESAPGVKDPSLIQSFTAAAKDT